MPNWPANVKHHYHVVHPMISHGTTWLRDSDLVFLEHRPYAVLSWAHDAKGDHPVQWCELNPRMLKHDRSAGAVYRYEGEIRDPKG